MPVLRLVACVLVGHNLGRQPSINWLQLRLHRGFQLFGLASCKGFPGVAGANHAKQNRIGAGDDGLHVVGLKLGVRVGTSGFASDDLFHGFIGQEGRDGKERREYRDHDRSRAGKLPFGAIGFLSGLGDLLELL